MKLQAIRIPEISKGAHGIFKITHLRYGKIISEFEIDNTATSAGKAEVAGLINEVTSGGFKWLALDSSSTAATAADTALASEITANGLGRAVATCSRVTTDDSNDTAQLVHTWTATDTQVVQGVGVFNTSTASAGTMLARTTFASKTLGNTDEFKITYKIDVD